ncbi:MAG TPA: hypothetical protein VF330_33135, partial [Lentzea sp.]
NRTWTRVGAGGSEFAVGEKALFGLSMDRGAVFEWTVSTGWVRIGAGAGNIYAGGYGLVATGVLGTDAWLYLDGTGWQPIGDSGQTFALTTDALFRLDWSGEVEKYDYSSELWSPITEPGWISVELVPCPL